MDLRALYRSTVLYDLRAALRAADPEPEPVFMNESEGILYTDERISSMRNRASWTRRDEASTTAFLVAARVLEAAIAAVAHQQEQQEQQQQQQL